MSNWAERDFWVESREQWAARLDAPDERGRDILLSHKFAQEQIENIDKQLARLDN